MISCECQVPVKQVQSHLVEQQSPVCSLLPAQRHPAAQHQFPIDRIDEKSAPGLEDPGHGLNYPSFFVIRVEHAQ